MSDGKEKLVDLHVALRDYMAQANKTCKLLIGINEFPVTMDKRTEILEQRRTENRAHEMYQMARQNLFQAAGWDG